MQGPSMQRAGRPSLRSRPRGSPTARGGPDGGCPGPRLLGSRRVPGGGRRAWSPHPGPWCPHTDRGALPLPKSDVSAPDTGTARGLSCASIFNAAEQILAAVAKTPGISCRGTNNTWEGSGGSASWQAGALPPWNSAQAPGRLWPAVVWGPGARGCPGLEFPGS